jgi:hypothetical protein
VRAESVMFMAIAVALVVIAVVVFARGGHDLVLAPRGQQRAVHRGRPRAGADHPVGAELSLVGEQTRLGRTMTELGVNAGMVVALSVALVPVRRFARLDRA